MDQEFALNRPDLTSKQLDRTVFFMNKAFPKATISGFESLIIELELPDENDRHILAAAIAGKATVIVTLNKKDFPKDYIQQFELIIQDPDTFIQGIIAKNQDKAITALKAQVARLKNPPQSIEEVLNTLEKNGLNETVTAFRKLL
jgi:hypothetical protein